MTSSSTLAKTRLAILQQRLKKDQLILLSNPTDIRYFSGFRSLVPEERESFLVVSSQVAYLLHASFSPIPDQQGLIFVPGTSTQALLKYLREIQSTTHFTEILIDKKSLFAHEYEVLLQLEKCQLSDLDGSWSWSQRMIKDQTEVAAVRRASEIARKAFTQLQPLIKAGMSELEVQQLLEIEMIKAGSERVAFPSIVCFGAHGALPHHQPTGTKLHPNTPILIDFGATTQDYRSDMTRSFWFGDEPSQDFINLETIVHQAYQASVNVLKKKSHKQPVTAAEVDEAAREVINKAGFGKQFIHTTGHGVGIDIHEPPSLNWTNQETLKPGMIITIEPGIYLDDKLGYRYENTVMITDSGVEELTL